MSQLRRTIDRNEGILQNIRRDGRVPNGELRTMFVPNDLTLPAGRERTEVAATHIFDAPPEGAAADRTMSQAWRGSTHGQQDRKSGVQGERVAGEGKMGGGGA